LTAYMFLILTNAQIIVTPSNFKLDNTIPVLSVTIFQDILCPWKFAKKIFKKNFYGFLGAGEETSTKSPFHM